MKDADKFVALFAGLAAKHGEEADEGGGVRIVGGR